MTNEMTIFNYGMNEVRTIVKDGAPWFVAKDVADVLEIQNIRQVLGKLDEDEKDVCNVYTLGGEQNATVISEAGLYSIVLTSRKPEAKAFKRWITHEVIPSIRKHGAYMTPDTIEKTLTNPDFIIQLATKLKEEQEARLLAERKVKVAKRIIAEQKPKVEGFEALMDAHGSICLRDAAKILQVELTDLMVMLRRKKVLLQVPKDSPAVAYERAGYLVTRAGYSSNGYAYKQARVTMKGLDWFRTLIAKYPMFFYSMEVSR